MVPFLCVTVFRSVFLPHGEKIPYDKNAQFSSYLESKSNHTKCSILICISLSRSFRLWRRTSKVTLVFQLDQNCTGLACGSPTSSWSLMFAILKSSTPRKVWETGQQSSPGSQVSAGKNLRVSTLGTLPAGLRSPWPVAPPCLCSAQLLPCLDL